MLSPAGQFGAAATEDGELWCFAVDAAVMPYQMCDLRPNPHLNPKVMSHKMCSSTEEWLNVKTEGVTAFRCRPGICALVTEQAS